MAEAQLIPEDNFLEDNFKEDPDPVENETDLEELLVSELDSAMLQSTDWTTETLLTQIERGRIQLNPIFQRRDAWISERKSKFIESLLLNFPIPQLVLAEDQKQHGKYVVIDGKQRLLSIVQFAGSREKLASFERLRFKGLEILKQYNGKTLEEIRDDGPESSLLSEFESRTIRTVVIRHWKHEVVLYHIFLRLNTGSVQLSSQELRNALHPGEFAEFIDEQSAKSPALRRILNSDKADFRMRDAELLLRYYAFRHFITKYAGSIKSFLDDTTKIFNESWTESEGTIRQEGQEFEDGIDLAYEIFGDKDVFRKYKDGQFIGRFNRAVFDVVIYYFCRPELHDDIRKNAKKIKTGFIDLSEGHPEFIDAIESTTKSLDATSTRFLLWAETLKGILKRKVPVPRLVEKRIVLGD